MIIAANLKTNFTRLKTTEYLSELENYISSNNITQEVLVFPATSSLNIHVGKVDVGAQNAYGVLNGAFTGEIGSEHLDEFGIKTILIGHSERRHVLGEEQDTTIEKFKYYQNLGYKIVYCIGESLQIREAGEKVMMNYLFSQLDGVDLDYENLIVAYEPIWAIGTGLTPTLDDIESLHLKLKEKIKAPLLYGGSVKVTNAQDILAINGVDGVLVGGASLYTDHFCSIMQFAQDLDK